MSASTETIASRFDTAARRYGTRPFLRVLPETAGIYGIAAGDLSYAAARERIDARAADYRAAGYGPGVRVGLLLRSVDEFGGATDNRTYSVLDATIGPAADRRQRLVLTTTATLRNRTI